MLTIISESINIYLNKKGSNNHSYKISGNNHYICRKCNTINTINNLETSLEKNNTKNKCVCCGKQLTNEKQHIFLHQNCTTEVLYTDWETDCVTVSYYPNTDVLGIRVQEIKYAGRSGCKAVCQKRYTTGIFDYKKKQIYTFSDNKVSNATFKHFNGSLSFNINSIIKYKIESNFTLNKIKKATINMSKLLTRTLSGLSKSDRQKSTSMDESNPILITLSFNFLTVSIIP